MCTKGILQQAWTSDTETLNQKVYVNISNWNDAKLYSEVPYTIPPLGDKQTSLRGQTN